MYDHILPQLEKAPIGVAWPLLASGLNPLPDAGQVFQGNPCSGALRRVHEPFGDGMVRPVETALVSLAGPRNRRLADRVPWRCNPSRRCLVPLAFPFNSFACIHRAIRIDGKIDYAQIDTKDTLNPHLFGVKDIADDRDIEDPFDIHQVHFALAIGQQGTLPLAAVVGNRQATVHRPDGQVGIRAQAKDPVIVGLRRITFEATTGLAIQLIGISNFGNTAALPFGPQGQTSLCTRW